MFAQRSLGDLDVAAVAVVVMRVAVAAAAGELAAPAFFFAAARGFVAILGLGGGRRFLRGGAGQRVGGRGEGGFAGFVAFEQRVVLQGLLDFGVQLQGR